MTKRHISRSAVVPSDAESVRRPQLRWRRPERLRRSSDGRRCSRDATGTLAAAPTTSSYFVRRQRHPRALLSERAADLLVIYFHPQEDFSAPQVMTWDSLQICVEEGSSAIRFGTRFSRREKIKNETSSPKWCTSVHYVRSCSSIQVVNSYGISNKILKHDCGLTKPKHEGRTLMLYDLFFNYAFSNNEKSFSPTHFIDTK